MRQLLPARPNPDRLRPAGIEQPDYGAIDAYARNAPESAARNLAMLSEYLTTPVHSELAKARSVYAWVTAHVRYDPAAYGAPTYSSEVAYADRVLHNRTAVCTGFALLYKYLLKDAGLAVTNIKGYARADDGEAGQPIRRVDHEWNAVRLDGNWYLLDLAWAQTTAKKGPDGKPQPNDFYFLTDPVAFGANHFPVDARWQLLDPPVSKAQFDQYPKIYDAYFRLGFDENFPKHGLVPAGENLTLTFHNAGPPVEFICAWGQSGRPKSDLPLGVRQLDGTYQLTVMVPKQGHSTLTVFVKQQGPRFERMKSYEGMMAFTVVE